MYNIQHNALGNEHNAQHNATGAPDALDVD